MGTMVNSEDPNEMLHKASLGSALFAKKIYLQRKKYNIV